MECPVCKYPNPQGATHCGMCYEVFNRSAAQNYLHAVKRDRRMTEGVPDEEKDVLKTDKLVEKVKAVSESIDWNALAGKGMEFSATFISTVKRFKNAFFIGVGTVVLW